MDTEDDRDRFGLLGNALERTMKPRLLATAYLAALSLPYLDIKTELYFEVDALGTTLAYERLRFHRETEHHNLLNMLLTVDHIMNGHTVILKKHANHDELLLSLLLCVVQSYMMHLRRKTTKAFHARFLENTGSSDFQEAAAISMFNDELDK